MGPSHLGSISLGPGTRDPRPKVMSNLVFVNLGWVPGPGSRKRNLLCPVPFPGPGTQNLRSQDPGPRSRKRNLLHSGPGTWDPGSRKTDLLHIMYLLSNLVTSWVQTVGFFLTIVNVLCYHLVEFWNFFYSENIWCGPFDTFMAFPPLRFFLPKLCFLVVLSLMLLKSTYKF